MTREEVLEAILNAQTHDEVKRAQELRDRWGKQHPDDHEIFEASEPLETLAGAWAIIEARNLQREI